MSTKPTCGPLFETAWKKAVTSTDDPILLFSAGHMCGQAEKIYLGACNGAMFRPSTDEGYAFVFNFALFLARVYGLSVSTLDVIEECKDEIWIHKAESTQTIESLRHIQINSPKWHEIRGRLCGIPSNQIDSMFHLRKGYNKPCDRISSKETEE